MSCDRAAKAAGAEQGNRGQGWKEQGQGVSSLKGKGHSALPVKLMWSCLGTVLSPQDNNGNSQDPHHHLPLAKPNPHPRDASGPWTASSMC